MFYELAEKAMKMEASGKRVIRLNLGDTGLDTPACAIEAAIKSMREKKAKYVSAAGIAALREAVAKKEGCGVDNVVVGPGSKAILYGLFSILASSGDKVVFPSPYWPAYGMVCGQLGLRAVNARTTLESGWELGELPLEGAKVLLLCNPLNPTSTVYSPERIEEAIGEALGKGIQVILDEAYRELAFENVPSHSGAVRVRSFSKEFNMEGWRIGYAIAPEEIAKKLVKFNQITATCVPEFVQQAAIACLENGDEITSANREVWKKRAASASSALSKAGFRFCAPAAGIYAFATHPGIKDSGEYALRLLEGEGVAVAPGAPFGGYDDFVRICLNQPEEILEEAIEKMGKALD